MTKPITMNLFIGNNSALEYWRLHDRGYFPAARNAFPKQGKAPNVSVISRANIQRHSLTKPLHVNVATEADRRTLKHVIFHVADVAPRSYVNIAPKLYVASPEASFLQIASTCSVVELVELGCELCSYYVYQPHEKGVLTNFDPHTSIRELKAYLARSDGHKGIKRARRAVKYIANNSASPMETYLFMLLCLPPLLGGYGLPQPVMNNPITVTKENGAPAVLRCDLYWPQHNFALEYDSDQYHSGTQKLNLDSKRRTLLEANGIHVLSTTKEQIFDIAAFEKLAFATAKQIGYRINRRDAKAKFHEQELRNYLLTPHMPGCH